MLTTLERNAVFSHRTRSVEVILDLYSFWKFDSMTLDTVMQLSEQNTEVKSFYLEVRKA